MFERVVYINRDGDTARRQRFEANVAAVAWPEGLPRPVRVRGCEVAEAPPPLGYKPSATSWACFRAHERIYRECLLSGVGSVLIFEDDAYFPADFAARFAAFMAAVPDDWQQVYFGGNHDKLPVPVNDAVLCCTGTNGGFAYGLRGIGLSCMYELLGHFPRAIFDPNFHIDTAWACLHQGRLLRAYAPWEFFVGHAAGVSTRMPEQHWPEPVFFHLTAECRGALRERLARKEPALC